MAGDRPAGGRGSTGAEAASQGVRRSLFGQFKDGTPVEMIRLPGAGGFEVRILTLGAAVQALLVPDRAGKVADVVLGHDDLDGYLGARRFFDAAVGRFANRIAGGAFELGGKRFAIAPNDGPNALHGGAEGFDRKVWNVERCGDDPLPHVALTRTSHDGEEGFPGTLLVRVTYTVTAASELSILFEAETDGPTLVNLTHHGYFNLAGVEAGSDILRHRLTLEADDYLPVDADLIPAGGPSPVEGTAFDFREPRAIGERIRDAEEQLLLARGYDHNVCVRAGVVAEPRRAARLEDPGSGRVLELLTDQPGVQFYSGNFLDGTARGKYGRIYRQADGLCLEPQRFPDTPNRPDFPTARLDPGETYRHHSIYRFSAD